MVLVVNIDWNPTDKERSKMPATSFLYPSLRKYPYKVKVNPKTKKRVDPSAPGTRAISCKMLKDALTLANMHGNKKVINKAKQLIEKYCK